MYDLCFKYNAFEIMYVVEFMYSCPGEAFMAKITYCKPQVWFDA